MGLLVVELKPSPQDGIQVLAQVLGLAWQDDMGLRVWERGRGQR